MAFERPIPSRLTLLRLRNQERLYRSIKKTVEDARNATIQRIRAIIPKLESARKSVYDELEKASLALKAAISKMSIEDYGKLSEVVRPSVDVEFTDIIMEGGLKFRGGLSLGGAFRVLTMAYSQYRRNLIAPCTVFITTSGQSRK